jgi:hypothetical protein
MEVNPTTMFILIGIVAVVALLAVAPKFTLIGKRDGLHEVRMADGTINKLTDAGLAHLKEHGEVPESVKAPTKPGATFDAQQYARALHQANDKIDLLAARFEKMEQTFFEHVGDLRRLLGDANKPADAPAEAPADDEAATKKAARLAELEGLKDARLRATAKESGLEPAADATKDDIIASIMAKEFPEGE